MDDRVRALRELLDHATGAACLLFAALFVCIRCTPDNITSVRTRRTTADLLFIAMHLNAYKSAHMAYPRVANIAELNQMLGQQLLPNDAWGTSYRYYCSADGRHYHLISAGQDRKFSPDIATGRSTQSAPAVSDDIVMTEASDVKERRWPSLGLNTWTQTESRKQ